MRGCSGLVAVLLSIGFGGAQTTAPAAKVIGSITAVDSAGHTISVKADSGAEWSVTLADKTAYYRVPAGEKDLKKASRIAPEDIAAGDRVLARGEAGSAANTLTASSVIVMTKADIAQKQAMDRAEWLRRGIAGQVAAIDPNGGDITISTQSAEGRKPVTVDLSATTGYRRYAPDSVKFADAKASTLAEIQPGDQLRALGEKNEDGTHFKAEQVVFGSFRTFAGTVISADPSGGIVQVTDLETKKPVTVHVAQETLVRTLPQWAAMMFARRLQGGAAGGAPGAAGAGGQGGGQWQRSQAAAAGGGGAQPSGAPGGAGGQQGGWNRGAGGSGGGSGGPGGGPGGGGRFDMQQMIERMPPLSIATLKKGDALVISSSKSADPSQVTALLVLGGVEPLLTAAPRVAGGGVSFGNWNPDIGLPTE